MTAFQKKNSKAFGMAIVCVAAVEILSAYVVSDIFQPDIPPPPPVTEFQVSDFDCTNLKEWPQNPIEPKLVTGPDPIPHDVIVIGAGIAGLEAAHELQLEEMDVVVLEGRDRIGGRVWTDHYNGIALDLGGSWIHGLSSFGLSPGNVEYKNPIYNITDTNNIPFEETYNEGTYDPSRYEIFYDSSGPIDSLPAYYAEEDLEGLVEFFNTKNKTVRELETVLKNYYNQNNEAKKNPALYRHLMEWAFEQEEATDIEDLSSENIVTEQYFNDDDTEGIFSKGYSQIANCLAQGLDIRHANVTKVDYDNDTIIVSTSKGDFFKAKYVVSTVPLGVLQKNMVEFSPPLPKSKTDSIGNLEMATMDKIYLIFKEPFWDPNKFYTFIHRVTDKGDIYPETWKFYFNLNKFTDEPILLVFHTGSTALEMEKKDKDELKKEAKEVLGKMYPNADNPEPVDIIRTKWAEDSLSWGSYSFIPVGGNTTDFDILAEPVANKLFFAGESTTKRYFGTVHGAYISGYRAAQEILELNNNTDTISERLDHGIHREDICEKGSKLDDKIPGDPKCIPIP